MKNSTMNTIYATLSTIDFADKETIMDELYKEIHRGDARKEANAKSYDALHDIVIGNLDKTPVTCGELYEAIAHLLPTGTTKGKVQYALTHLWKNEIVTIEGKPNTYRLA